MGRLKHSSDNGAAAADGVRKPACRVPRGPSRSRSAPPSHSALGRRGIIGVILIIIVILASTYVIITTYTARGDIPDVSKASLMGERSVRDLLAKAILDWLHGGVTDKQLACNGIYPVDMGTLNGTLAPYVQSALATAVGQDGMVAVKPGVLSGIGFQGADGLTVTLANGSVVYNDSAIYAADYSDQGYFYNVRLPLALSVTDDWLTCDAGNLSMNLAEEYGVECFFGKKNPAYPGGCPLHDPKYRVSQEDRDYMLSKAITISDVTRAAQRSVDDLNAYFAGNDSCKLPRLASDSGIVCGFEIQDFSVVNEILPWSSNLLVVNTDPSNVNVRGAQANFILQNLPSSFDIHSFMGSDAHVWALPPSIEYGPFNDRELQCAPDAREPVDWSIPRVDVYNDSGRFDLVNGQEPTADAASPIMYVNTTRGAIFTLVIKCKDNSVSLLGQPLDYTFSTRYGLKQQCGQPKYMMNGNYMCSGCSLKPGVNFENCVMPGMPAPCSTYEQRCNIGMIWQNFIEDGSTPANPAWQYKGSAQATIDAYPDLQELINMSCGTVMGHEDKYPPPRPPPGHAQCLKNPADPNSDPVLCCIGAYAYNCCGVPGYNATCSPDSSLSNSACFTSDPTYTGLCTQIKACSTSGWSVGQQCTTQMCNASQNACVDSPDLAYGVSCGSRDSKDCYKCGEQNDPQGQPGICRFEASMQGQSCTPGSGAEQFCQTYTCDKDKGCVGTPVHEGETCSPVFGGSFAICSTFACANGYCMPKQGDTSKDGTPCDTETLNGCTYQDKCKSGRCLPAEQLSCPTTPPPGVTCNSPCKWTETGCKQADGVTAC